MMISLFYSPRAYFSLAVTLRIGLMLFGIWQDANTPLKYTDIDYYVFTDAARFVSQGQSPYNRDTYRYTPLLAWILWPTTFSAISFSFGKILFAAGDILAGWLIIEILKKFHNMTSQRALAHASIWLLNPMVAVISTRGSSEGLLGALVVGLLWTVLQRRIVTAGILLGLGVHLKIYPFIYAPSIIWWLDEENTTSYNHHDVKTKSLHAGKKNKICEFFNSSRLTLAVVSLLVFLALNTLMYSIYGNSFLEHTYLYHMTRIDHRHNFSPYNVLLYLSSASPSNTYNYMVKFAFLPQLILSTIIIPLILAKKNLPATMLAQTLAFVSFNKVCTSQYFIWYLIFLPLYLPDSCLLSRKSLGILAAAMWTVTQAAWLQQASQLEFFGRSTFVPGLWLTSISFFLVNCWILSVIVQDIGSRTRFQSPHKPYDIVVSSSK
ncbi:GPI mannosyltransferase 1 [Golovinomyces cichoracearum]|uniref:GPI mannosyltransferase 1 n=1 Tax=Golovinomyces cichoracearum TaxID=62708 RepID=A0A420ILH7_9PEZI|nr:GPI mannosyltransferase 1 [Golovinomyces cichoracearum]